MKLIDKEYIKKKVIQAIELMPYDIEIYRERLNSYKELEGYDRITVLKGVLYSSTSSKVTVVLKDKGEVSNKAQKKFLVDYNENSKLVKSGDYIIYKEKCYKVLEQGEEFEIYFDMQVEEIERIKI